MLFSIYKKELNAIFIFGATDLNFIKRLDLGCSFEDLSQKNNYI